MSLCDEVEGVYWKRECEKLSVGGLTGYTVSVFSEVAMLDCCVEMKMITIGAGLAQMRWEMVEFGLEFAKTFMYENGSIAFQGSEKENYNNMCLFFLFCRCLFFLAEIYESLYMRKMQYM